MQTAPLTPELAIRAAAAAATPPLKKARKPYVITKHRECWTTDEHELFVAALKKHGRNWKAVEAMVKTKSVVQIRSHAQKYFQRMEKNGAGEQVPPPRPKRRNVKRQRTDNSSMSQVAHSGPNFCGIYANIAGIMDPARSFDVQKGIRDARLSPLDKEIMRMLIDNLQTNVSDAKLRGRFLDGYREQVQAARRK